MKILFTLFLFQYTILAINGQELDTIIDINGDYMIIRTEDNNRLKSHMQRHGGVLMFGNYRKYSKDGTLKKESVVDRLGDDGYTEIVYVNGKKLFERIQFQKEEDYLGTFKLWNESGNLIMEEIKLKNNWEEKSYYENEGNTIKRLRYYKRNKPEEYKGLLLQDKEKSSLIIEKEVKDSVYILYHEVNFYANNRVESEGSFSKRIFVEIEDNLKNREWYNSGANELELREITIFNRRKSVKHGKWKYFDQTGNLIREDNYNEGKIE